MAGGDRQGLLPTTQIWPLVELPLRTPFTVQLTWGLEVCVTEAVNVCLAPGIRVEAVGLMLTATLLVSWRVTEALRAG